jgi:hypothetical protein
MEAAGFSGMLENIYQFLAATSQEIVTNINIFLCFEKYDRKTNGLVGLHLPTFITSPPDGSKCSVVHSSRFKPKEIAPRGPSFAPENFSDLSGSFQEQYSNFPSCSQPL